MSVSSGLSFLHCCLKAYSQKPSKPLHGILKSCVCFLEATSQNSNWITYCSHSEEWECRGRTRTRNLDSYLVPVGFPGGLFHVDCCCPRPALQVLLSNGMLCLRACDLWGTRAQVHTDMIYSGRVCKLMTAPGFLPVLWTPCIWNAFLLLEGRLLNLAHTWIVLFPASANKVLAGLLYTTCLLCTE